ncbi:MAG: helix-turn-helix domain-containing protein [Myxococcota bacterium]
MLEAGRSARVRVVEANAALRAAIVGAVVGSGFEASAMAEAGSPVDRELAVRHALHLIDLGALGAPGWLVDPEARARSLFLAADRGEAAALAQRYGPALDLLVKPFSVQALEARLLARLESRDARRGVLLDPMLQTRDERFARTLERAWRLARLEGPLCIAGELGTGRRALAQAIVAASPRAALPSVAIDGLGLEAGPGDGLERELAEQVARAGTGTLLVIEPADWSPRAQAALLAPLRALEEEEAPRCITLARAPIDPGPGDGRLLVELAYRLAGPTLVLPPIRERAVDQLALCQMLARRVARSLGRATPVLDEALLAALARDGYPGNRFGIESRLRGAWIGDFDRPAREEAEAPMRDPAAGGAERLDSVDLRRLERDAIVRALGQTKGNRTHASQALGISVRTLRNKIREYGLR